MDKRVVNQAVFGHDTFYPGQELRDWDTFRALLQAEGQDEVFFPVCSDPYSGAGLYLVGLRNIPWARALRRQGKPVRSCYYVFLLPFDLQEGEGDLLDLVLEEDPDHRLADYPSTREAVRWFWGFGAVLAARRLPAWNDTPPPAAPSGSWSDSTSPPRTPWRTRSAKAKPPSPRTAERRNTKARRSIAPPRLFPTYPSPRSRARIASSAGQKS